MATNYVQNQYAGQRKQRGAVWLTKHGSDEIHSVSLATYPEAGTDKDLYRQVLEGTVMGKGPDGLHYPLALDSAQAAVVAANDVVVADPLQFQIGQEVELPTSVAADATRFRKVTAIDYDTSTLTLDGAAFSLSEDDQIQVDPTRSFGEVKTTAAAPGAAPTTIAVLDGDAAKFEVGDVIDVGDETGNTVTAIDTTDGANTVTVDANIAVTDGDKIVSQARGGYKITDKTVTIDEWRFTPQNVLMSYRPHGRVKEALVIGLVAAAKTELAGLIIFDQRTIA